MTLDTLPVYPYGVKIAQTWQQIALHMDAIERFEIRLFVELGVHEGGMASVLLPKMRSVPGFRYIGVEYHPAHIHPSLIGQADILLGDCLDGRILEAVRSEIKATRGAALVFCDNGNKPAEIRAYAPLVRPGDFISVHDYGTEIQAADLEFLAGEFEEIEAGQRRYGAGLPLFRKLKAGKP